jgi:hypothetical protein
VGLEVLMMKQVSSSPRTLNLGFSDKDGALRLLQSLALDARVSVNIMRARITEDHAWLELELEGPALRVAEVAALLQDAATMKDPDWRPASRAS